MGRMEDVIKNMVDMFVEYADGDGKLSKEELKKLMETEISNPEIKAKMNSANHEKIMGRLDRNRDGELNFREFCMCVGFMAKCAYHKKTGKGDENES
ncbi:protein S100-A6-like [Mugil cephalus]|uniref:protein S100-A6-like n=1 Tax=Mugil cephalus TaxID=48193 RepID=UPI001FB6F311|nr:protein S100-A6-like [Mugil cephalus]